MTLHPFPVPVQGYKVPEDLYSPNILTEDAVHYLVMAFATQTEENVTKRCQEF